MDKATHLEHLLDDIQAKVSSGAFELLPELTRQLEDGLSDIAGLPKDALKTLQLKAARNANCLVATARGVRAARRRIAEIRALHSSLGTYDSGGNRADMGIGAGKMTQRF